MTSKFTSGQPIMLEVEARRLGSMLRPVLHLYNDRGLQLQWARPSRLLAGDVRLSTTLPADGRYTVELHDAEFAGPQPSFFRLKIGSWQFADVPFPPAVERGKSVQLSMTGNAAKPVEFIAPMKTGQHPAPWSDPSISSGPQPIVLVSETAELVEAAASDSLQLLPPPPVAISGRLRKKGEEDRYSLTVQPGARLRCEVFADRLGSPIDGVLEVQRPQGGAIARGDDAAKTPDPQVDFTVPADVKTVVLAFKDLLGRGAEDAIYRISVTNLDETSQRPDFDLEIANEMINVTRGGETVVAVHANRKSYEGPIKLDFTSLPTGVSAVGAEIPAGASGGLVTLRGAADATGLALASLLGVAAGVDPPLVRPVLVRDALLGHVLPWNRSELPIAAREASGQRLSMRPIEAPADSNLVMGGQLKLPVRLLRSTADGGPVRLSILTSLAVPQQNGQPDPNQAIRLAANVELPVDAKAKQAADALAAAEKTLAAVRANQGENAEAVKQALQARDVAAQALKAAEDSAKNEGELILVVPAGLAAAPYYEVAVHAELLNANKQVVLAEFYSPPLLLKRLNPILVELAGGGKLAAKLDGKTEQVVKATGKILRRGGLQGDITVTVEGLPAGIAAPKAVVKADQTDFALDIKFPANFKPGNYENIRVFATGKLDPKSKQTIRSDNQTIAINLAAPAA